MAHIATGQLCEQGYNLLLWDTPSATGTKLPAGRYLLRIRAAAHSGLPQQALTAITIQR